MITSSEIVSRASEILSSDDYSISVSGKDVWITFEDFVGFDENWCEKFRKITDEDAIDEFEEWVASNCVKNCHRVYEFDGCVVHISWSSEDI